MTHGSLFSGIGGFDLAAEWMGWENKFHCEWNEFGQKILSYYWPNAKSYGDITKTDFNVHRGQIDVLTGGFPCQPFSGAGKRKGKEDNRYLWPEMLRAIKEIQPTWIVAENVFGIINQGKGMVFEQLQAEMENEGYQVQPYLLPACAISAPHKRDRFWFIAYSNSNRKVVQRGNGNCDNKERNSKKKIQEWENEFFGFEQPNGKVIGDTKCKRLERRGRQREGLEQGLQINDWANWPTQSPFCGRNDGLQPELLGITVSKHRTESIKGYGNAIVPQLALQIFKAIEQYEKQELILKVK